MMRYSCQMALPDFTTKTQQKLTDARVLIVGAGGLGCPASQYLASSGIGTIGIADYDIVSISNLHRQILYSPSEAGQPKALVACEHLRKQNPLIHIIAHNFEITSSNILDLLDNYDIVVDCTDNFNTRYLLNDACALKDKPLVYGAIYQYEGQVAVWNLKCEDGKRTPNYRDLFPQIDSSEIPNCSEGGVIPTIAGIVGCMQANEVIKFITGNGDLLAGKIFILDALTGVSRIINIGDTSKVKITELEKPEVVNNISASEFNQLQTNSIVQLIDVRSAEERAKFNIGGQHIPLELLESEHDTINISKPVVVYCASGRRSAEAVKILSRLYPEGTFMSLKGGTKAWQEMVHGWAETHISPSS